MEDIESRMKEVDGSEIRMASGLSPEAYSVYRQLMASLKAIGGVQSKAARLNALLFARHADQYARILREKNWEKDYTALDYYRDTFAVAYGENAEGGLRQTTAARRLKEDMLAWKRKMDDFFAGKLPLRDNVMMRSPLVFDLIGADSRLDIAIDSSILQKLVNKHHFTRKDLLQLPKKIADPLFVLRAIDTKTGMEDTQKRIVVVDMEINGATVMIPFVVNTAQGLNKIASAYGREKASGQPNDQWYIDRLNQKNLLYINKKRTVRWVATRKGAAGRHNAPLTKQSLYGLSIADEMDLSKLKKEHRGFYQRAWHGSPYDFDAFLNRMIGVGEGAQAHGWGLYFAKDKTISDRYKENLKKSHKTLHTLTYDGKTMDELPSSIQNVMQSMENAFNNIFAHGYSDALATLRKAYEHDERIWQERLAEFERPIALYEENPKASVRMLRESTPQYSNARNTIDAAKSAVEGKRRTAADVVRTLKEAREIYVERIRDVQQNIRDIDEVDANKFHLEVKEPIGKLFEVEIPDDDVLLDEQKTFDEQPSLVQKKLERMFSHIDKASILYRLSRKDVRYEEVYGDYCEFLDLTDPSDMGIHEEEAYVRELKERVDAELKELLGGESLERAFLRSLGTGQEIYRTVGDMLFPHRETDEAISRALNAQGIKGITYDGRRDGRCYVVFDEKAIDIVAKFNQEKGSDVLAAQKEAVRKQYAGSALWMKAPNGVQTNLTEEQWLTVRTPAFKAWFGDWEQVAEATPKINVQNIQEAKEVLHKLGNKPIENKATGIVASVSKRGRGKLISAGTRRLSEENGYTAEEHLLAAANVEQLFQNAILSETHEDRNGELASVKLFSSLVMLNKKPAIACFTVKETTNAGHKIYSVQMLELKKSAGTLPRSAVKRSSATADLSAISIAELADKYNPLFDRVDVIEKDTDLSTNPDPKSGREKSTSFIEHSITQCWNDVNSLKIAGDVDENGEPLASSLMGRERTRYKKSRPQAICGVGSVAESAEWRAGESHGRAMAHSAHTYVQGAIWRLGRGI